MTCQRCNSNRLLECQAHASDLQFYTYKGKEIVENNYAPYIDDICGGDDLVPTICLECGQVQGKFPKFVDEDFLEEENND